LLTKNPESASQITATFDAGNFTTAAFIYIIGLVRKPRLLGEAPMTPATLHSLFWPVQFAFLISFAILVFSFLKEIRTWPALRQIALFVLLFSQMFTVYLFEQLAGK